MLKKALFPLVFIPFGSATASEELDTLKKQIYELNQKVELLASESDTSSNSQQTHMGGYGELHFNAIKGKPQRFDFHRFVLMLNHRFSDNLHFYSELEIEHALVDDQDKGELELEQAYIDWAFHPKLSAQIGMMLQPVGFINETHEPDTFYGVERPILEKDILPTTWWSSGAGLSWKPHGWQFNVLVSEGLYDEAGTSIRGARQKSAKTISNSLGYTVRANYTALPGITLGASAYWQDDLTQGKAGKPVSTLMTEAHAEIKKHNLGLRMLWAKWSLDGDTARSQGKDTQTGWYIEPSYKLTPKLGVFTRYTDWYTDKNAKKSRWLSGVNYWIHPRVVLKADYQAQKDNEGYNLGLGYSF